MPLDQFITETLAFLKTDADEIVVEAAKAFRGNPGPNEHALVNGFNQQAMASSGPPDMFAERHRRWLQTSAV